MMNNGQDHQSKEVWLEKIGGKQLFVMDLDGVLYLNDILAPRADEAVCAIRAAGRRVAFLTNNSIKSKENVCEKLNRLGVACDVNEVYTSVDSAIRYLKKERDLAKGVLLIGSEQTRAKLEENGIVLTSAEACRCVLVGFKRDLSYADVTAAVNALRRGVPFVICNKDPNFPDKDRSLLPGCGYVVGAIEGGSGRRADVNVGKPETGMLELLYDAYHVSRDDIVIVGDTYNSDIVMAKRAGIPAIHIGGKDEYEAGVLGFDSLYAFTNACFGHK